MQKMKTYNEVRFSAETLKNAEIVLRTLAKNNHINIDHHAFKVEHDDSEWKYDSPEEFFADYRKYKGHANFYVYGIGYDLNVIVFPRSAIVIVNAPTRGTIESVFNEFEKNYEKDHLPALLKMDVLNYSPTVFIGHGQSALWRVLKDHLQDQHKIEVIAYETGAIAGYSVKDNLEKMVQKSSFALLILTGEDEQKDGTLRARQNVVHEAGLFQGRLGFSRAIMIVEEGVEDFSNISGIHQIRFSKGNIKETFGDILATLQREFNE